QRRVENELRQSNERFAAVFHSDAIGVAITSIASGRIVDINDRALSILGITRADAIGHTFLELGFWDGQTEIRRSILERAVAGVPVRMEPLELIHRTGTRIDVTLSVERVELAGKPCLLSIFDDMGEHRRIEDEARRLAAIVDAGGDAIVRIGLD